MKPMTKNKWLRASARTGATKRAAVAAALLLGACSILNAPEALRPDDEGGSGASGGSAPRAGTAGSVQGQSGETTGKGGSTPGAGGECGTNCMTDGGAPPIGRDCDVSADDCGSSAPICDATDGTCRACTGNQECKDELGRDFCGSTPATLGRCMECKTNAQCTGAEPVCGPIGNCQGCTAHSECETGVCDLGTGACLAESAAVYVLAQTGVNDPNCGQLATPCYSATVAAGKLSTARPNLVFVATNQVMNMGNINLPAVKGLQVIGNQVVVAPYDGVSAFRVPAGASVVFDGVVVQGSTDADQAGITCTGASVRLRNSTLRDNRVALLASDCDVVVEDSLIKHNAMPHAYGDTALVSDCTTESCPRTLTIQRSRFEDNGVAMSIGRHATALIENNLFLRNGADGYVRVIVLFADATRFAHNTLVENFNSCTYVGIVACNSGTCTGVGNVSYNNFPGQDCYDQVFYQTTLSYSLTEATYPGLGNKTGNPLFVDAANGNYTPGPGSPALDSANPADAPADDLNGAKRPVGDGPDMGAIEAQ